MARQRVNIHVPIPALSFPLPSLFADELCVPLLQSEPLVLSGEAVLFATSDELRVVAALQTVPHHAGDSLAEQLPQQLVRQLPVALAQPLGVALLHACCCVRLDLARALAAGADDVTDVVQHLVAFYGVGGQPLPGAAEDPLAHKLVGQLHPLAVEVHQSALADRSGGALADEFVKAAFAYELVRALSDEFVRTLAQKLVKASFARELVGALADEFVRAALAYELVALVRREAALSSLSHKFIEAFLNSAGVVG